MPSYYYNRNKLRGGSYEDLHLSGSVSMLGPIKVDVMRMNGDFFGEYTLKVGTLHATGSMRVPQMRCTSAFWYGNSAVRTKLQDSQHLSISGQFIGEGTINAPDVRMNGTAVPDHRADHRNHLLQRAHHGQGDHRLRRAHSGENRGRRDSP